MKNLITLFCAFALSFACINYAKAQQPGTVKSFTKLSTAVRSLGNDSDWNFIGTSMCMLNDMDGDGNKEIAMFSLWYNFMPPGIPYIYIFHLDNTGKIKPGYTRIGHNEGNIPYPEYDDFGGTLANMGDMDGNGIDDIVTQGEGYFATIYLNKNGTADSIVKVTPGTNGVDYYTPTGLSIANVGDIDGDGVNDIATGYYYKPHFVGSITIFFMKRNGRVRSHITLESGHDGVPVLPSGMFWGSSIAPVGDLNKDGVPDIVVSGNGGQYIDGGKLYTLFMKADGTVKNCYVNEPGITFPLNTKYGDLFGFSIANIGDIDGDTVADLAVSAPMEDSIARETGRVYIMMMNRDGSIKSYQTLTGYNNGLVVKPTKYDRFGYAVAGVGDINGDNINDVLIGEPGDDGDQRDTLRDGGAIYLTYLNGVPVTTGVGDVFTNDDQEHYSVYPNPASTELFIKTKNGTPLGEIFVYDAMGKLYLHLKERNQAGSINVSSMPIGNYLIKIGDRDILRFIKN
jgi:hypothetical protein